VKQQSPQRIDNGYVALCYVIVCNWNVLAAVNGPMKKAGPLQRAEYFTPVI
jgi:hypothetical protein